MQVIADPTGFSLWCSPVAPGSTHDRTAAREHCLAALHPRAVAGLPTLADKGYQGAGIGVHHPITGHYLGVGNRADNALLTGMRAIGERAHALLTQRWMALCHVAVSPRRIGAIGAVALVLTTLERGTRCENLMGGALIASVIRLLSDVSRFIRGLTSGGRCYRGGPIRGVVHH